MRDELLTHLFAIRSLRIQKCLRLDASRIAIHRGVLQIDYAQV
jgi:hypothetical protein